MKVHQLRFTKNKRPGKRLGRGYSSGKGSTSGRGQKGELSRAGNHVAASFTGGETKLIRRLPKRRGFHNKWKKIFRAVDLAKLDVFSDGDKVSLESLWEKGIVNRSEKLVKIVGKIEFKKKLTLVNLPVTKSVRAAIEKAGGSIMGQ